MFAGVPQKHSWRRPFVQKHGRSSIAHYHYIWLQRFVPAWFSNIRSASILLFLMWLQFCTLEHWATVKAAMRKKQSKSESMWKRLHPMEYSTSSKDHIGNPRCYHSCEQIGHNVFLIGGLNRKKKLHGSLLNTRPRVNHPVYPSMFIFLFLFFCLPGGLKNFSFFFFFCDNVLIFH